MNDVKVDQTVFLTMARSIWERASALLLIDSIRSFGGAMSHCPIWLFESNPQTSSRDRLESMDVRSIPLSVPDTVKNYYFGDKVYACALAEEMSSSGVQSLIWIDPMCLIIRPPLLMDLEQSYDAAVRPVHIKNVGLAYDEPLDGFWKRICEAFGIQDIRTTVETFVDMQLIRSYFNSHAFSVRPSKGFMREWFECFETLTRDADYQKETCQDERHQVFLHQAVLSVLLVARLSPERMRVLPPDYNYPYNLHQSVPPERRAEALNDPVSIACEKRSLDPGLMDDIEVHEPLRSWLAMHASPEP